MKIKLSKSQWEKIGKKAGWTGYPQLTPKQENIRRNIEEIINQNDFYNEILLDILHDAVSEQLEANAKQYRGSGIIKDFSERVNEIIKEFNNVLSLIQKLQG